MSVFLSVATMTTTTTTTRTSWFEFVVLATGCCSSCCCSETYTAGCSRLHCCCFLLLAKLFQAHTKCITYGEKFGEVTATAALNDGRRESRPPRARCHGRTRFANQRRGRVAAPAELRYPFCSRGSLPGGSGDAIPLSTGRHRGSAGTEHVMLCFGDRSGLGVLP